jgi:limonene-1,2-epoxide hydrolase
MSTASENKTLVEKFWATLYERNWDAIAEFFDDESHYEDVPAPDTGADGTANIVARLKIGLDGIERFDHATHLMVAEGDVVMTEHTETWHFHTGEIVANPFVSVHVIANGKIKIWRDHWDLQTLLGNAPKWWLDRIMAHSEADFT